MSYSKGLPQSLSRSPFAHYCFCIFILALFQIIFPVHARADRLSSTEFYAQQLKRVTWRTMPFRPLSGTMVPVAHHSKRSSGARSLEMTQHYDQLIREAAVAAGIDPNLIHAIVLAESNYDPYALSPKGAIGLMQLMPQTASRFEVRDPFDPEQNIRGGCDYIGWLMRRFDQDLELVLAAYNAGEMNVVRSGRRVPQFDETQRYVRRVKSLYYGL